MPVTIKAEPINRDIVLFLDSLSPDQAARRFAELAAQHIAEAKAINVRVLHREPPSKTFVDGAEGAPLHTVRADGVIVTEFEILMDVLIFISRQLEQFSPVKTGRYRKSHALFADGLPIYIDTPAALRQIERAEEFIFVNTAPYARKIESGSSQKAPNGVYEAVANIARRRFSQIARITFSYRTVFSGSGAGRSDRNPAIVVRTG